MKRFVYFGFLVILFLFYCLYLSQYQITVTRSQISIQNPDGLYDYKGLTHVHSRASSGSGSTDEIVEAALRQRFDFMFMTEVNPDNRALDANVYRKGLLVLSGGEYTYLDSRLMYYGGNMSDPPSGKAKAQAFFADLLSQTNRSAETGIVILAHPFLPRYEWTGEYPEGLNGIEVINLRRTLNSAWSSSKFSSFYSAFLYTLNPTLALIRLFREPAEEIFLWDTLNKKRKTVGMFGSDATAKAVIVPGFSLNIPSYDTTFAIASTHLLLNSELTGEAENDSAKVLAGIREGQFYICLDIVANPKGFSMSAQSYSKTFLMGSTVPLTADTKLKIHLPQLLQVPFEVRIYKDGELYSTSNSVETVLTITAPGVYRAEVRVIPTFPLPEGKRWIPWIYTNPIFII